MAEEYYYEPLNPLHHDSFRYLSLHPGEGDDPIVCDLFTARLSEIAEAPSPGHVSYEAISYVWGCPDRIYPIKCNGKMLYITANLKDALCRVRLLDRPRSLWTDSICINQSDSDEKAHQVGLMGDIYSKATEVIIDIGPAATEQATSAASLVREIYIAQHSPPRLVALAKLERDPRRKSLDALFMRPWFEIGWVVQEAARVRKATVLWGITRCEWGQLMLAHNELYAHKRDSEAKYRGLDEGPARLHASLELSKTSRYDPAHDLGFLDILSMARRLRVTDERDRIFAFINVAFRLPDYTRLKIVPNYRLPFTDIYTAFARDEIRTKKHAEVLRYVQHDDASLERQIAPSWVPRWDIRLFSDIALLTTDVYDHRELTISKTPPTIIGDSLELQGVVMGSVEFVSDVIRKSTTQDDILKMWREMCAAVENSLLHDDENILYEAFLDALDITLPMMLHNTLLNGKFDYLKEMKEMAWTIKRAGMKDQDAEADKDTYWADTPAWGWELPGQSTQTPDISDRQKYHHELMSRAANRKFIITDSGCYGTVPPLTKRGDVCAVLLGVGVPFVLRKTATAGRYQLIGEALMITLLPAYEPYGYPQKFEHISVCNPWSGPMRGAHETIVIV